MTDAAVSQRQPNPTGREVMGWLMRGEVAMALGVLLTPLAALLPTLQLGLGEDHDCGDLVRAAQRTSTTRQ